MVEFPLFFVQPLIELYQPVLTRFSAPFLKSWEDISLPVKQMRLGNFTNRIACQKTSEKLVKNIIQMAASVAVFFIYQIIWNRGSDYFGFLGGLCGLYAGMAVICHIDPKIFYLANSAWFLYKGLGILRGVEDGRLLCLLLIDQRKFEDKDKDLFRYQPVQLISKHLASSITSMIYKETARSLSKGLVA